MSTLSRTAELTASQASDSQCLRNRGMGVMFLAFFGSWWLYLGASALAAPSLVFALVVICGGALFLAGLAQSRRGAEGPAGDVAAARQRSTAFRNTNIVQWSAIVALVLLLNVAHRVEWITPGIMLIVGLHFFPLARVFRRRGHVLIGVALCAVALSYPFLAAQGPLSPDGPIAAGLILWSAAFIWALKRR